MSAVRFKLDENIAKDVAIVLRERGHDVETVHDEQLAGAADEAIASACRREARVLVTFDLDFADVRAYPPAGSPGIIILRPPSQTIRLQLALVDEFLRQAAVMSVTGQLWIIEPGRLRIRI